MRKVFDLKRKVTWEAWKFGVFKLCVGCLGIILGAYFADFFRQYYIPLWIVVAITWSFTAAWWFDEKASSRG